MKFYSSRSQALIGPVWLLPQRGSVVGGSKRPLNSWAIVREHSSILFDAPVSWAMDGIRALAKRGQPPVAMVISHRDLAASGDAFDDFVAEFDVPVMMHPDDQIGSAPRRLAIPLTDPMSSRILDEAGIQVIRIPGHSPGSIMLYLADAGGVLLAGDAAVGPGPEQTDRTPRLERPVKADNDARFLGTWKALVGRLPLAAVLPLHGEAYLRRDHQDFDEIVANLWSGDPMDPTKV